MLSHVIGEDIVYPIMKATSYTAHAQYHVTCAQGVLKTTHDNFLTPNYLFTIQLLWGYDDSYILEHPHVKAIFGRNKLSKTVPKITVFRKFKRISIKYSHRDPRKALPYSVRLI